VARLVGSIEQIGLQTPISVRWAPEGDDDYSAILIAGAHRLEACRRLEMMFIPVMVHEGSNDEARMWEISENLHRADLTALERSEHVAEWVRLAGGTKVAQVGPPGGKQPRDAGINAATRALGIGRTDTQRAVKVDSLSPEAKQAARAAGLDDNRTALLKAARAPPERQADAIRSYEPSRVKPAPAVLNEYETLEQWRSAGIRWWNRGGAEWRTQMGDVFDPPVFDKSKTA